MKQYQRIKEIFNNMTIKSKLIFLSGWLLLALIITNLYGGMSTRTLLDSMKDIYSNTEEIKTQAETAQNVLNNQQKILINLDIVQSTTRTFGKLKYWLTDLSASWQNESEDNAEAVNEELENLLKQLTVFAPNEAKSIGVLTEKIYELSIEAVDYYVDDNRIKGNSLLAEARRKITKVDEILMKIVEVQKSKTEEAKLQVFDFIEKTIYDAQNMIKTVGKSTKNAENNNIQVILFEVIIIIISVILILFSIRSLIIPIKKIVESMRTLATGNINIDIPSITKNEIGELAEVLQVFKDNKIKADNLAQQQQAEQAAKQQRAEKIEKLVQGFEKTASDVIQTVASAATELHKTAENMSHTIVGAKTRSIDAAVASGQASDNVRSVAAASEQLSSSTQEISSQIAKTSQVVNESVNKVEGADKTARSLSEATMKIGEVVELIQNIAEQINLLALNATIESARAGEAGKGFAVVASEVKNLANQTGTATEEISKLIQDVQCVSSEVIDAFSSIHDGVKSIDEYTSSIASAVEEQSAVTNEIAFNMQAASTGVANITENISSITESTESADNTSKQVLDAAQVLSRQSETLSKEVSLFLSEIKVA